MNKSQAKLNTVVAYMNKRFNQDSDEYCLFMGAKPMVIRYDGNTAISTWACGAIVCIGDALFFIEEDDGYWYCHSNVNTDRIDENGKYSDWAIHYGSQSAFSIGWAESFATAMTELVKYVKENGEPVYYSGTDRICHYELKEEV